MVLYPHIWWSCLFVDIYILHICRLFKWLGGLSARVAPISWLHCLTSACCLFFCIFCLLLVFCIFLLVACLSFLFVSLLVVCSSGLSGSRGCHPPSGCIVSRPLKSSPRSHWLQYNTLLVFFCFCLLIFVCLLLVFVCCLKPFLRSPWLQYNTLLHFCGFWLIAAKHCKAKSTLTQGKSKYLLYLPLNLDCSVLQKSSEIVSFYRHWLLGIIDIRFRNQKHKQWKKDRVRQKIKSFPLFY